MGCSSSAVSPDQDNQTKEPNNRTKKQNFQTKEPNNQADIPKDQKQVKASSQSNINNESDRSKVALLNLKNQQVDKNGNKLSALGQTPVPKSVAFDVNFDDHIGDGLKSFKKRPPRLQALEPLNTPKLTAEQLQEKKKIADEKRRKLKERKINASQKSSRRMRELNQARQFEQSLLTEQGNARQTHNPEDEAEIEKDEQFNTESADTWLGIPDKTDLEEEHGLQKRVGQIKQTVSSTTIDSYDAAFMRESPKTHHKQSVHNLQKNVQAVDDDFFDS